VPGNVEKCQILAVQVFGPRPVRVTVPSRIGLDSNRVQRPRPAADAPAGRGPAADSDRDLDSELTEARYSVLELRVDLDCWL
jgi:hypothetical protein